jgi:dTDP-4-dehydrorhamnose reductase
MSESQVLITGASGFLGRRLMAVITSAVGWHHSRPAPNTVAVDITNETEVNRYFSENSVRVCLHCAANPNVDSCQADPAAATRLNVEGTRHVAHACAANGTRLIHISTDYVFDGAREAYSEEDEPAPMQVYGRTKAQAEALAGAVPGSLIVRLPLLYGPEFAAKLRAGAEVALDDTAWRQPTHVDDAAAVLAKLVDSDVTGILHVAADKGTTKYQWALGLAPDPSKVHRAPPAPNRPPRSWLLTRKLQENHGSFGVKMRPFNENQPDP